VHFAFEGTRELMVKGGGLVCGRSPERMGTADRVQAGPGGGTLTGIGAIIKSRCNVGNGRVR